MKKVWIILLLIMGLLNMHVKAQIIATIAGTGSHSNTGDGGPATAASVNQPYGCAFDNYGNFYFTTEGLGAAPSLVRMITPCGIISTIAGTGVPGYNGDSISATAAELNYDLGIAFDAQNNLYIADAFNNRVRKVDAVTGMITTIAGNGTTGFGGDGGPATNALLNEPENVCFDRYGNLYIVDGANTRIRKVDTLGIITTFAGNGSGGNTGDGGPATDAEIENLYGISSDTASNIYIDYRGIDFVRKIDTAGIITTIAGDGSYIPTGDGGPATAAGMDGFGMATDREGNIYVAGYIENDIRKINDSGIIYTVAGDTIAGFSGDGGPATAAEINAPYGIAIDPFGNLYICDDGNARIRKVTFNAADTLAISLAGTTTAAPGTTVTVDATVAGAGSSYNIYWYNNGALFATTTTPAATYTQTPGADTITAMVVPTGYGCYDSSTSAPHVVMAVSTGIQRAAWGMGVHVYPNPASNVITVAANNNISNITITNLIGQTVYNLKKCQFEHVPINVSDFPAGVYFVDITDEEGNKTVRKIVKE